MQTALYLWRLNYAVLWLSMAFVRAALYFRRDAIDDLDLPKQMALNTRAMRRMQHYFYGTTFLSIVFGLMHHRRRTPDEKALFSNMAALSYHFDDLADAYRRGDAAQQTWLDNPEVYGIKADSSGLSLHLLRNVYRSVSDAWLEAFKDSLYRVFNIETAGRQQQDSRLNLDAIKSITQEKGGHSVMLFRYILNTPMAEGEEEALYAFGGLVQLCDDITDVWFDHRDHTQTVPLVMIQQGDLEGLRRAFDAEVSRVRLLFSRVQLPNHLGGPATAWAAASILAGIARVCLEHYTQVQKKNGTLPLDDRGLMVVDMERWTNRFRLIGMLLRHNE